MPLILLNKPFQVMSQFSAHPERQTVVLYGDGAIGFSLADFDSLARHHANVVGIGGRTGIADTG